MRKIVRASIVPLISPILKLSKNDIWFIFYRKTLQRRGAILIYSCTVLTAQLIGKKKALGKRHMATSGTQIIYGCYFVNKYGILWPAFL
jgi:hypothetical protein